MAALADSPSADDVRLNNYLDDKLQSTLDLDNLDDLLAVVEEQHSHLQSQLEDAIRASQSARRSADERQRALQKQIDTFQSLQRSIDVRWHIVISSDTPDEAIRRLEGPMHKLHKVDLAYNYLLLLQDVERLRAESRSHLPKHPKDALEPYTMLKQLASYLRSLQVAADQAATYLVTYVSDIADALWDEMKKTMWSEMDDVLLKRGWPKKVDARSEIDDEWRDCFEKSIDLQVPELLYPGGLVTVLPIEVMAQNWTKEFQYHFMSDKSTSSPRVIGTQCFPWIIALLEEWDDFMRDNFADILVTKLKNTAASNKMVYIDPTGALITALLPIIREKVTSAMEVAVKDPIFLSSFISQLVNFDDSIRSQFCYDGGDPEQGWGGLTSEVLDKHFDKWLEAEKSFALERYKAIVAAADTGQIDYEYNGPGKTEPTYGAVRVIDLLRSVTTQYERVRKFSHRLRFLIEIQIEILDLYHDRLNGSIGAYRAMTSTAGKMVYGATREQLAALEGTGALETLCKILGSADHVVRALKDWSNEEFFVDLWAQLHSRAKKADDQSNLAGGMSHDEVRCRTSQTVGTGDDNGIIFDETIKAYANRRQTAEDLLIEAVIQSHAESFRPYMQRAHWTIIGDDAGSAIDPYQLAITAELDEPLRILKRDFDFLARIISAASLRRVIRGGLKALQDTLWSEILRKNKFTALGAAQFWRDLQAIFAMSDRYACNVSDAMTTLADAVKLLNLPLGSVGGDVEMSLKEASDRVFTDNSEARKVLEEMGIETLEPANARMILQRRIENSD